MEMIKEINPEAYVWLMKNDLDKWTLHRDGGRRWGMLTTNSSESFNGLLKSAEGFLQCHTHLSTITNKGKTYLRCLTYMHHGCGGNKHIGFDQIGYQAWEHMAPEFSLRSYKKAYSGQFNPLPVKNIGTIAIFL
ncbi:hypothetical protein H5410_011638 [Solanum commersonii]|uniref:Uncharacterized protein n=1 Tax=Solanum commersonii TaxID=4109 RepID=A0A9J6APY4_SOLCO|nr:hypothetical protein H5410_011638 [Solanum commersonii]